MMVSCYPITLSTKVFLLVFFSIRHLQYGIFFFMRHSVSILAVPRISHLVSFKCILRYLRDTMSIGLLLPSSLSESLFAYSDANQIDCLNTHNSITIFGIFFGLALTSWRSHKHMIASCSST